MAVDPRSFHLFNMVDTCAVWNVLASRRLYQAAIAEGCIFSCTGFVIYECLFKPRQKANEHDFELQRRLIEERKNGRFHAYNLGLEELQEVEILERRRKLGKGELSSIAFAKQTGQAFLTDDQRARRLALEVIHGYVQTTPHLFGWLLYTGILEESDRDPIIAEHQALNLPLAKWLEEICETALRYRSYSVRNN
jgi:hypothetical protein